MIIRWIRIVVYGITGLGFGGGVVLCAAYIASRNPDTFGIVAIVMMTLVALAVTGLAIEEIIKNSG